MILLYETRLYWGSAGITEIPGFGEQRNSKHR